MHNASPKCYLPPHSNESKSRHLDQNADLPLHTYCIFKNTFVHRWNVFCFWLTTVVFHQFLQGGEGVGGGDVVATFVQTADLVVFNHISFWHMISDRQWERPWGGKQNYIKRPWKSDLVACAWDELEILTYSRNRLAWLRLCHSVNVNADWFKAAPTVLHWTWYHAYSDSNSAKNPHWSVSRPFSQSEFICEVNYGSGSPEYLYYFLDLNYTMTCI